VFQLLVISAAFAFGLVVLFTIIGRARNEGRLEQQAETSADAARRLARAMEADAAARARDAAGKLLQDDGYRRDVRRVPSDHVVG
jgi:hypothetical protein